MDINFKQCNGANYRPGRTGGIRYVVIHYTANNGDTARGNANYFANNDVGASAHYFVDEDEIWQSIKDGDTAWHCGAKTYRNSYCRNPNSLGVELCSRKDGNGKYYFKDETVDNAVLLVKILMTKYHIPVANILRHYDVTGKNCPAPFVEDKSAWENFKEGLTKEDTNMSEKSKPAGWAEDAAAWAVENKIIRGDENNDCKWQEPLTREAFAVMLKRYHEVFNR